MPKPRLPARKPKTGSGAKWISGAFKTVCMEHKASPERIKFFAVQAGIREQPTQRVNYYAETLERFVGQEARARYLKLVQTGKEEEKKQAPKKPAGKKTGAILVKGAKKVEIDTTTQIRATIGGKKLFAAKEKKRGKQICVFDRQGRVLYTVAKTFVAWTKGFAVCIISDYTGKVTAKKTAALNKCTPLEKELILLFQQLNH